MTVGDTSMQIYKWVPSRAEDQQQDGGLKQEDSVGNDLNEQVLNSQDISMNGDTTATQSQQDESNVEHRSINGINGDSNASIASDTGLTHLSGNQEASLPDAVESVIRAALAGI